MTAGIYIAGPMTGYPDYNYAAFHDAEEQLRHAGFEIISNPARHFDGDQTRPREQYLHKAIQTVLNSRWVVVLPGWEHSEGAKLEVEIARQIGLPVFTLEDWLNEGEELDVHPLLTELVTITDLLGDPDANETPPRADVLMEAAHLITGDRNNSYGPPAQDFVRSAGILSALGYRRIEYGPDGEEYVDISGSDIAIMVASIKLSRLMHSRTKRDNWTDLAGYAGCGYEVALEEGNENGCC